MTEKQTTEELSEPMALEALKRAAKRAVEIARQTNTPAWIMVNGKIVDATKLPPEPDLATVTP